VDVHFRDLGSKKWAKPKGVHGIELRWSLLTAPLASVEDLKNSAFDTKTSYLFTFDEAQRGHARNCKKGKTRVYLSGGRWYYIQ
jgi:hypothetical protein